MSEIVMMRFKRSERSKWEPGMLVNNGTCIIDASGLPVLTGIYDDCQDARVLCLNTDGIFAAEQKACDVLNSAAMAAYKGSTAKAELHTLDIPRPRNTINCEFMSGTGCYCSLTGKLCDSEPSSCPEYDKQ